VIVIFFKKIHNFC